MMTRLVSVTMKDFNKVDIGDYFEIVVVLKYLLLISFVNHTFKTFSILVL